MGNSKNLSLNLESHLQFFFHRKGMDFATGPRFLILLSGGVDSSVLWESMLRAYPKQEKIIVLHINYQLRGSESEREAIGLRNKCKSQGMIFYQFHCPLDNLKSDGGNIQKQARDFRYQKAVEVAIDEDCDCILVAQHRDDQLETFFYKLLKGQSPASLVSMKEETLFYSQRKEVPVYRPFLSLPKSVIVKYAQEYKVDFYHDSSNDSNDYERNYLRNKVFPLLDTKFSYWRGNLNQVMSYLTISNELVESQNGGLLPVIFPNNPDDEDKKEGFRFLGFCLPINFNTLSKSKQEFLLHQGLWKNFRERRFSKEEILQLIKKVGDGKTDKVLFYDKNTEVVFSRGWVGKPINFIQEGNEARKQADLMVTITIKFTDGKKWSQQLGFYLSQSKKNILEHIVLIPYDHASELILNYSIDISLPESIKVGRQDFKNWKLSPLSDFPKSIRVGGSTLKKHIGSKKYPLPIRSSLLALSDGEQLLGAIDLWNYKGYYIPFIKGSVNDRIITDEI